MTRHNFPRRDFLSGSVAGAIGAVSAFADPARAAAQAVGVKPADFPDLTIKEVKTYVLGSSTAAVGGGGRGRPGRIVSIVTNSGIEGNCNEGAVGTFTQTASSEFLAYAKGMLVGKSALDLPAFTSIWDPTRRRHQQSPHAATIDYCLWDILGKAVHLPVYRILGAYRDRVLAYASSQHLAKAEDFVNDVKRVKAEGYKAYKIHPPWIRGGSGAQVGSPTTLVPNQGALNLGGVDFKLDLEVSKAVRQAAGDDMILLHDRVGAYTRDQALKMGLLLDELDYAGYEDPLPSVDVDGLVELKKFVHTPIHMGELVYSMYEFATLIRLGALDVVRFIGGNIGGITGGMKLAKMAEGFGLECAPHNYGDGFEHAVHFHCELAMPNCVWFELLQPAEASDRPWIKEKFRIDKDGCIPAPTKPGLGIELDRDVMDKLLQRIDT